MPSNPSDRSRPTPTRPDETRLLGQLCELLVGAGTRAGDGPTLVVGYRREGGHIVLDLVYAGALHPLDVMARRHAPPEHDGVVVAATGTASHLDRPGRPRTPIQIAVGLARSGAQYAIGAGAGTGAIRPVTPGGTPGETTGGAADDRPIEGRTVDACHRWLGLPTPQPSLDPGGWCAAAWIDQLFAVAAAESLRGWSSVVAALPVETDGSTDHRHPAATTRWARHWSRSTTWSELRTSTGVRRPAGLDAATAAWTDDGMFARWCLSELVDPDDAWHGLCELLPPEMLAGVARVVAELTSAQPPPTDAAVPFENSSASTSRAAGSVVRQS